MTEIEAARIMEEGAAILDGVLAPHGFTATAPTTGVSSGGSYASCQFVRGNRRLRLHFRYSLGLVEYEVGGLTLSHEEYMWSVLGRRGGSRYPGFSSHPLDGFRHLSSDLAQYGHDFLSGSDQAFVTHAEQATKLKQAAPRLPA